MPPQTQIPFSTILTTSGLAYIQEVTPQSKMALYIMPAFKGSSWRKQDPPSSQVNSLGRLPRSPTKHNFISHKQNSVTGLYFGARDAG